MACAAAAPYPELVRVRLAMGWAPEVATVLPYVPRARLTPEQVEQVRTSSARPEDLARQFGIGERHVRRIRAGTRWKRAA